MTIDTEISEVATKLHELKALQDQLINEKYLGEAADITKLEWCKDCTVKFEASELLAAGLPSYKLFVYAPYGKAPSCHQSVKLFGEDKIWYQQNVMYSSHHYGSEVPVCYTDNIKTLVAFLKVAGFKKILYDETLFEALSAVVEVAKAQNES